jgi:hypothetical protein
MLFDIIYKESVGHWIEEKLEKPRWGWDSNGKMSMLTTKKVYKHKKFVEKVETKAFKNLKEAEDYAKMKYPKLVSVMENMGNSLGNMFPDLMNLKND